jgi:large repetitive protein
VKTSREKIKMNAPHTTLKQVSPGTIRRVPAFMAALVLGVVLQGNLAHATIDNVATASGTYAAAPVVSPSSSVSVTVAAGAPSMLVTKTASPNTNLSAGQVITYTYTVKNTGNVSLINIGLTDVHNAIGAAPVPSSEVITSDVPPLNDSSDATAGNGVWSSLAPGDTITFTATYTVQQSDVDTLQ